MRKSLILAMSALLFTGCSSDKTKSEAEAWAAIRSHLNSPSTASIAGTTTWSLKKYKAKVFMFDFDGQNGFGGMVRNQAIVLVYKSKKDGEWHAVNDVAIKRTFNGIEDTIKDSLFSQYSGTIHQDVVEN